MSVRKPTWNEGRQGCDYEGRGCGLQQIPSELYDKYSHAVMINLADNEITELDEQKILLWNYVQYLQLHNNNLTEIPDSIGKLTTLRQLTVHGNKSNSLPKSLINLTNLHSFWCDAIPGFLERDVKIMENRAKVQELWTELFGVLNTEQLESGIEHGYKTLYRGCIILSGAYGAGKTSTKRSLFNEHFVDEHLSTDGAEIYRVDTIDWIIKESGVYFGEKSLNEIREMYCDATVIGMKKRTEKGSTYKLSGINISDRDTRSAETSRGIQDLQLKGEKEDDMYKRLAERLKGATDSDTLDFHFTLWDFAGQSLYYITHQVFLAPRGLYILVTDLSKDLDDELITNEYDEGKQCWKGCTKVKDILRFWINSIHAHATMYEDEIQPKIIIAATKTDLIPEEKIKQRLLDIKQFLGEKTMEASIHLAYPEAYFPLSNKPIQHGESNTNLFTLRNKIRELSQSNWFRHKVPSKWFRFELELRIKIVKKKKVPTATLR